VLQKEKEEQKPKEEEVPPENTLLSPPAPPPWYPPWDPIFHGYIEEVRSTIQPLLSSTDQVAALAK